jgi:tetratricopeptide (TPR) repeat protein
MKFFVSLVVITVIAAIVYYFLSNGPKRNKKPKINRKAIAITIFVTLILLGFLAFVMYRDSVAVDLQCSTTHATTTTQPATLKTAMDYFLLGNYDYDTGNCQKAITDYTTSISLNPKNAQAYNNRAYTYMRLRDYKNALTDLNKALTINPNYIQALMNRGDIHNYYYQIDRQSAIADYEKVIALGGTAGTSVCGHLLLARTNGWTLNTIFELPFVNASCQ